MRVQIFFHKGIQATIGLKVFLDDQVIGHIEEYNPETGEAWILLTGDGEKLFLNRPQKPFSYSVN